MIEEYIKEGKIVPVEVTVKLLLNAIAADGGKRFLIDGFRNTAYNLSGWQQVAGESLALGGVLFYDCPEETMEARLLERGKTSGRTDDNIESIRKRFKTYQNETMPILRLLRPPGALLQDQRRARRGRGLARYADHREGRRKSGLRGGARDGDADCQSARTSIVVRRRRRRRTSWRAWRRRRRRASEEGAVGVSGRVLRVDGSMKAFDMDALRAFD